MATKDNTFSIVLDKFHVGYSPLAFQNSLTEQGSAGASSDMQNVDILNGDYVTQGAGLADLTNGTQAGAVTELIQFIMDKAVADDETYAIGTSKLFKLSSTAVSNSGAFPHAITSCTEGESIQVLKSYLYYFYNTASAGGIGRYDLTSTFNDTWNTSLQNAPHPSDKKEDIMVFGNGRYVGTYINETTTLTTDKLDFGEDLQCDDVLYNSGYWYLAINSAITGTNRSEGQIYLWDGSATPTTLSDEAGVGVQRIGFLYRINGIIYVAYQDLSSTGFIIGYINGKSIKPLKRFTGTLPNFQQKTLYKNTIAFLSSGLVWSAGALVDELPYQLSQIADGGYATVGAIAAPFGTPMISSTDEGSNFKLVKFSGYETDAFWSSIVFPVSLGRFKGYIDDIIVLTSTLGAGARCDLTIEYDQASSSSSAQSIMTTGKRRHLFKNFGLPSAGIEDFRITLDWVNGSVTNDCPIREIIINGHFIER